MATDYNSKYSGEQIEALLDQVASGNAGGGGGGGGITVETDPIFSATPAATITEQKIAEWDAKSAQGEKGDKGDTGVGVQSVAQTTTSNADGGTNVVTVILSNGTTSTFNVKNGSKGSSGSNGTNGKDGADGATFTPSVDSNGNLSWTNNKGLTNPPTVNIKGPKGDSGEGGGSGGGKEVVVIVDGVIELLERDKIYIVSSYNRTFEIQAIEDIYYIERYAEFRVILNSEEIIPDAPPLSIILPDNVYWANGQIPDLTLNANYELSIVGWYDANNMGYNAVITPFKPV